MRPEAEEIAIEALYAMENVKPRCLYAHRPGICAGIHLPGYQHRVMFRRDEDDGEILMTLIQGSKHRTWFDLPEHSKRRAAALIDWRPKQ